MRKAHTLIESIMVVVLVGVLSFVFALYIQEGFDAWQFLSGQKSIALSSRAALNRIVREIKKANPGTLQINNGLSFTDVEGKFISYSQNGTNLYYSNQVGQAIDQQDILLSNLAANGLQFSYLDENGQATVDPQAIRVVICRLTVVKDANKFVIESAASLRQKTL